MHWCPVQGLSCLADKAVKQINRIRHLIAQASSNQKGIGSRNVLFGALRPRQSFGVFCIWKLDGPLTKYSEYLNARNTYTLCLT